MSINVQNKEFPLNRLIEASGGKPNFDTEGVVVRGLTADSRAVGPADLFFALIGDSVDGHSFVAEAMECGAAAAVVERIIDPEARLVIVPDTRLAMAVMAKEFFGKPDEDIAVVGITGTNGKTTCTYMMRDIGTAAKEPFGVMGTLGYVIGESVQKLDFTTPDPIALFRVLAEMRDTGLRGVAMEISSHGLAQKRSWGIDYDVIAFTCLTQDHLDYHGDMESYFDAKASLFESIKPEVASVINIDDAYGRRLLDRTNSLQTITYGIREKADIRATEIRTGTDSVEFVVTASEDEADIRVATAGLFNVYNSLCSIGIGLALGYPLEAIAKGLTNFCGVAGRLERIEGSHNFSIYVDYSHTPDALYHALNACRDIASGRVIVVFGAGGDRDKNKRPKMGRVAGELADIVVLTSDNPRTEAPSKIIDEIEAGVPQSAEKYRIDDRKKAIEYALELAKAGDVVLIAGKGHEDYQIIGKVKRHFDDREIVREWLSRYGYRREN